MKSTNIYHNEIIYGYKGKPKTHLVLFNENEQKLSKYYLSLPKITNDVMLCELIAEM